MDEGLFTDQLFWLAGTRFDTKLQDAHALRKQCDKVAWMSTRMFCCYEYAFEEIKQLDNKLLNMYIYNCCILYDQFADNSAMSVWMLKLFDQYRTVLKCSHQHAWLMMQQTVSKLVASGQQFLHLQPTVVDIETEEGAALVERMQQNAAVH